MRHLGIDFGTKRVGLALSDEGGNLAFPLSVLENSKDLIKQVIQVCEENSVGLIVVGESKDFDMKDNVVMKDIKIFVEDLKKETNIPLVFHPEFLTSAQATQIQGKNKMLDASAASIILQSYLDKQKNDINR